MRHQVLVAAIASTSATAYVVWGYGPCLGMAVVALVALAHGVARARGGSRP